MTATVSMLAPNAQASETFVASRSGNSYTSDAYGVIKSVTFQDAFDLQAAGALSLGALQGRNNRTATTNPGVTNDNTQDYAIGSEWLNTSTGVLYVATAVGTGAASWAVLNAAGYAGLPWVTGRFYGVPLGVTPVSFLTVASTLYAYPIFVPNKVTLAALQASVISGQTGGKVELGLYADASGYPGAIVAGTDTGDLAGTSTTLVGPTNLAVALNPGWYWAAVQAAASSTMPSIAGGTVAYTNELGKLIGADSAAHELAAGSQAVGGISKGSVTYAALPATFPAGAAPVLNAGVPLVSLGV